MNITHFKILQSVIQHIGKPIQVKSFLRISNTFLSILAESKSADFYMRATVPNASTTNSKLSSLRFTFFGLFWQDSDISPPSLTPWSSGIAASITCQRFSFLSLITKSGLLTWISLSVFNNCCFPVHSLWHNYILGSCHLLICSNQHFPIRSLRIALATLLSLLLLC